MAAPAPAQAQRPLYQDHSDVFAEHEIFDAVGVNDVKRVRELLDCGVDINIQDFDKGWSPLHVAAARGAKQAMELLVQRGCDVNVQVSNGQHAITTLLSHGSMTRNTHATRNTQHATRNTQHANPNTHNQMQWRRRKGA
jgi:ankyrin repeat protein